ncbi:MAG: hypothetical protein DRJ03_29780 [Chloroflexi bacterium]|nr:MAG: hypothetical protein DRJ03_29780 [Chloroflexota bacterium]
MALKDTSILVPECPVCWTISVKITHWTGAFLKDEEGTWRKVWLKPGEKKTIQCKCNDCGHEWEEYVEGV